VLEEEELANLRQQQHEFEEIRNAELVEMQRLQEQERRRKEEKVWDFCFNLGYFLLAYLVYPSLNQISTLC